MNFESVELAAGKNLYFVAVQHTAGLLADDIAAGRDVLAFDFADVQDAVVAAQGHATEAAGSATAADASASAAGAQAVVATTQAGLATSNGAAQVALAAAQVTLATGQATAAGSSATASAGSASSAAATFTSFDKRFLGARANDPALDNQGAALAAGALYFNTTVGEMRVYGGAAWLTAYLPATGYATTTDLQAAAAVPNFLAGGI